MRLKRLPVTRHDLNHMPMPSNSIRIDTYTRHLSHEEFRLLCLGLLPQEDGEFYYIYREGHCLYLCIGREQPECWYGLRYEPTPDGVMVVEAWKNPKINDLDDLVSANINYILDSALLAIPFTATPAKRDNWLNLKPMPKKSLCRQAQIPYSEQEFLRIAWGYIPRSLDCFWFVYVENLTLRAHISQTGSCVYEVRFEPFEDGYHIVEIRINCDERQVGSADFDVTDILEWLRDRARSKYTIIEEELASR